MEYLQDFQKQLANMAWSDYLDIFLVGCLLYYGIRMIRTTASMRVIRVVGAIVVISMITSVMELHTLNFLISQVMGVGLISLVVLFQPELRRIMDHLGCRGRVQRTGWCPRSPGNHFPCRPGGRWHRRTRSRAAEAPGRIHRRYSMWTGPHHFPEM